MYFLVAIVSHLVRNYLINSTPSMINLMDIVREFVLWKLTYAIVGWYYGKNSNPAFGSLLYLIFYIVHSILFAVLINYDWKISAIILCVVIYSVVHVVIAKLSNTVMEFRR